MGVARHLGIRSADYDRAIRRFIPGYAGMLAAAAAATAAALPACATIVDLGTGTGALAAACKSRARGGVETIFAIDADSSMESAARRRLGPRLQWIAGDFRRCPLPAAHAIVSALALHHVRTEEAKARLYRRCRLALRPNGVMVNADCCPALEPTLAAGQHVAWRAHLRREFPPRKVEAYFAHWAREDRYLPLETEMRLLRAAGLAPEVVWRQGAFAVILAHA